MAESLGSRPPARIEDIAPDQPWQRLVYSGGLAQKIPTLRQLINDRFGVPDRLAPSSEDTMMGLLVLALVADERAETVVDAIAQMAV